ncbi:MAG: glycosyltransferase family 28 [Acidimicrobiia bacterium]|nr:glycosyltransferase family 28 [Acidimicrobiia bacterium]
MTAPHHGTLLFYCQHSLGLGHLVRSLALAEGLASRFDVVLLNGGRFPEGVDPPRGVEVVNLAPLGHDDEYQLISHDPSFTVEQAKAVRVRTVLAALAERRPSALLIELYPFGRKKFAFELLPLLETVEALGERRPRVVCSLRDILVGQRRDQAGHDERASTVSNRFLDAILVHADPRFARLEESFRPATPLGVPVHYTGFVTNAPIGTDPRAGRVPAGERLDRVIVSAGGGMVGEPLFRAAIDAQPILERAGLSTLVVAGPFAPPEAWARLEAAAAERAGLDVVRYVDDLRAEIARSTVSVSQCGYNTTMDLLRAGVPAVVVPYSEGREDEQRRRAARLAGLGVLGVVESTELAGPAGGARFAEAVLEARTRPEVGTPFDLDGAARSAELIAGLVGAGAATVLGAGR